MIQDRLSGLTMQEIADKHGITKGTVCRILNKDEIKEAMEQEARVFVSLIPHAVDVYKDTLLNESDRKIKLSAAKDVCQATGILPTHTPALIINNSFNQTNTELTADVVNVLSLARSNGLIPDLGFNQSGGKDQPGPVIEAETVDDKAK